MHDQSSDTPWSDPWTAERAIVLQVLREDKDPRWTLADLQAEAYDIDPTALGDALDTASSWHVARASWRPAQRCTWTRWGCVGTGPPDMHVPGIKVAVGPLEDNSPVAWFDFHGTEPPVDFDPHLALVVSLHEPATLGTTHTPVPLIDTLKSLCHWVEWDIFRMRFEPLFA